MFKHQSLQSIQIKASHKRNGDRSWIYDEYISMNKELNQLNQTQFKILLNITTNSTNKKEDTLGIDRL